MVFAFGYDVACEDVGVKVSRLRAELAESFLIHIVLICECIIKRLQTSDFRHTLHKADCSWLLAHDSWHSNNNKTHIQNQIPIDWNFVCCIIILIPDAP